MTDTKGEMKAPVSVRPVGLSDIDSQEDIEAETYLRIEPSSVTAMVPRVSLPPQLSHKSFTPTSNSIRPTATNYAATTSSSLNTTTITLPPNNHQGRHVLSGSCVVLHSCLCVFKSPQHASDSHFFGSVSDPILSINVGDFYHEFNESVMIARVMTLNASSNARDVCVIDRYDLRYDLRLSKPAVTCGDQICSSMVLSTVPSVSTAHATVTTTEFVNSTVTVTVTKTQMIFPTVVHTSNQNAEPGARANYIHVGYVIVLQSLLLLLVVVIPLVSSIYRLKSGKNPHGESHMKEDSIHGSGNCVEKEVFNTFYAKLVKILPVVDNIYNKLVPEGILDIGDIEEIDHTPRSDRKASIILQKIRSSLQAGDTDSFYTLLKVMETSLNDDVMALVEDIRGALK